MSVASLALSHKAEDQARSPRLRHPSGPGLQFDPAEAWLLDPDGEKRERQVGSEQVKWVKWKVEVRPDPDGDLITRKVWRNRERWNQRGGRRGSCAFDAFTEDASGGHRRHDEVIWPTWPGSARDEAAASPSPLAAVQDYWRTVGNRLRDSAKWTAAVLGAGLATVIGTSPLAGMSEHTPQPVAILLGSAGLVFLGTTMFLVLQVMRPQSVSYTDVQYARKGWCWLPRTALYKWRTTIESQQDLYLPYGVKCLTSLLQSMIIEEVTLMALSCAKATVEDHASSEKLGEAHAARAARLRELRTTAAMVVTVGEYYKLRHRSSWATYGGILCGLLGTAAIVSAFAWPLH